MSKATCCALWIFLENHQMGGSLGDARHNQSRDKTLQEAKCKCYYVHKSHLESWRKAWITFHKSAEQSDGLCKESTLENSLTEINGI